jgi:regulator of sigma E protease
MLVNILAFALVFTFIALVHELGHLVWAKRAGIRVYEFGLGFGPRLFSFTRNSTVYSLNLVPILGFVKIAGEGEAEEDKFCPPESLFSSKTPLQKFKCLFAGPFMNIFAAFLVLFLTFSLFGIPSGISNEIGSVTSGSPADQAGLQVGDRLISINGHRFARMEDAIDLIHKSGSHRLTLLVSRGTSQIALNATPKYNSKLKVSLLGFSPRPLYKHASTLSSLLTSLTQVFSMIVLTLVVLWQLLIGGVSFTDLAGPVGIAQVTGKYTQSGWASLLYFTAFLNVNIGIINLLPIPALDGGHLTIVFLEWVRRKPFNQKLINRINYWGFIALLGLMVLVTFNDLLRLFARP